MIFGLLSSSWSPLIHHHFHHFEHYHRRLFVASKCRDSCLQNGYAQPSSSSSSFVSSFVFFYSFTLIFCLIANDRRTKTNNFPFSYVCVCVSGNGGSDCSGQENDSDKGNHDDENTTTHSDPLRAPKTQKKKKMQSLVWFDAMGTNEIQKRRIKIQGLFKMQRIHPFHST